MVSFIHNVFFHTVLFVMAALNKTAAPPCPLDYYSTDPIQLSPWKVWMMSEAVRQNLIGHNVVSKYTNDVNTDGMSPQAAELMRSADVSSESGEYLAMFWNLSAFQRQLKEAKDAFPPHFHHTVATKANPLARIIEAAAEVGVGAEAASLGEMLQALRVQPPERVMLDSPAKTVKEIEIALDRGVGLTIDNFQELARVDAIIRGRGVTPNQPIGMRLNPQIGTGLLATYSVSKPWGKFGLPANEVAKDIVSAYVARPWLSMVHCHAGSQSYTMEQIASALRLIVDIANEINEAVRGDMSNATPLERRERNRVKTLDIGGGLMVNFKTEENTPSLHAWAAVLKSVVPELFTGEYHVITELGRRYLAKQGVIVSKVEYVKQCGGRRVVLQHAGADIAVRTVYKPDSWPLRATAFNRDGTVMHPVPEKITAGELLYADIAGPCCLDDVIYPQQRPLPDVAQNDFIMLHDTGAYYHSSYSYYNMRQTPAVYAFYEPEHWNKDAEKLHADGAKGTDVPVSNGEVVFELVRPACSVEETMDFFASK